jgi:hypothetical protein
MLPSQIKRQRRIEKHCIAPVVAALHAGQISPRSADSFLRLSPDQQVVQLERRLSEAHEREARHRLVADTIRKYLAQLDGKRVDLIELAEIIRKALVFAKTN